MNGETGDIELSIIAPAHNEQENIAGLVDDVRQALEPSGLRFEMIIVDDGSSDATAQRVREQIDAGRAWLRGVSLDTPAGRGLGPSAAYRGGIEQARGELIAIIDADRQNDPKDLPKMVRRVREQGVDLIQGDRSANRRDNLVRRASSVVGRTFRRAVLGDAMRDSACALRVMRRQVALAIPFHFKGMQRFTAYYAKMIGYRVEQMPVAHHPRVAGEAKFGIWNRAMPGLLDLLAVRWMKSRWRRIKVK